MELNKSKESFTYESSLKIKKSDSRHPDFVRKKKTRGIDMTCKWNARSCMQEICKWSLEVI